MLSIGNLTALPGEKVSGNVPIHRASLATEAAAIPTSSASNNATTTIAPPPTEESEIGSVTDGVPQLLYSPVTIVNGIGDGPTLVVLGGIHGSEYVPILATQQLGRELDPSSVRGSVVLVHVCNLPAYLGRTIYTSPADGKNLNRVFPGDPNGTPTERIADFLVARVYPLADALLDMHSGDANERLGPPSYTGYYGKAGSPELVQRSRDMAVAFGTSLVVEFQWELEGGKKKSNGSNDTTDDAALSSGAIWAGSAAVVRGIPSIDVEVAPGMGESPSESVDEVYRGVRNVMVHLEMLSREEAAETGGAAVTTTTNTKDRSSPKHTNTPCIVTDRRFVDAPTEGSWIPLVDTGIYVAKGTLLGTLADLAGRSVVFEARAPRDGLLLIRIETPPVVAGDTVAVIAVLPEPSPSCKELLRRNSQTSPTNNNTNALSFVRGSFDDSNNNIVVLWRWASALSGWLVALGLFGVLLLGKKRRRQQRRRRPTHRLVPAEEEGTMA